VLEDGVASGSVSRFVSATVRNAGADGEAEVALFRAVQAFAYATDRAHDASTLLVERAGSCLAKSGLLCGALREIGLPVDRVRFAYRPPIPPGFDGSLLGEALDIHAALRVHHREGSALVDPTLDPPLARLGFPVAEWDGRSSTVLGFEPVSEIWSEGRDDAAIAEACERVAAQVRDVGEAFGVYRQELNAWLRQARRAP
jgi:Transglutaminase-like superfamily